MCEISYLEKRFSVQFGIFGKVGGLELGLFRTKYVGENLFFVQLCTTKMRIFKILDFLIPLED